MAQSESNGGGATGIVAIAAIVFMLFMAAVIAWRAGWFGGGGKSLDIDVDTPSSK